ncbi:MAG: hypothetical protein ACO3RV_01415 [Luteolibacter sp.]
MIDDKKLLHSIMLAAYPDGDLSVNFPDGRTEFFMRGYSPSKRVKVKR